jgi:Animal haem peroxidase
MNTTRLVWKLVPLLWALPLVSCDDSVQDAIEADKQSLKACTERVLEGGFREVADVRTQRFLGKVDEDRALCRGGEKATKSLSSPWVDWPNYWGAGDVSTLAPRLLKPIKHVGPNGHGIDGALIDLEYQRIELIKFNLFDNNKTYETYVKGRDGVEGRAIKVWPEMQLSGEQKCRGELIRFRTVTGICNDLKNPLMGSTDQLFARNVEFDTSFPDEGRNQVTKNRHADRIGLLKPDPQVISRKLFTRPQSQPDKCHQGYGPPGNPNQARCDYQKAPFFNVLAAFWIQFMTHDWFSHLKEGHNQPEWKSVGCETHRVGNVEKLLTEPEIKALGCRPGDRIDKAYIAEDTEPEKFTHGGKSYLTRAPKTTQNHVTAWWDASQIYGYDERSRKRAMRGPADSAKLKLERFGSRAGEGEQLGTLPDFASGVEINKEWTGQEATAFPDNWSIGLSFFHNVFAREHNVFVDQFRAQARKTPREDSGLRNPARPDHKILYEEVTPDELFEVARLVVAAEIAKIHTIEWTTQLLYNEPLYEGMNANWSGLFRDNPVVSTALKRVVSRLGKSTDADKATTWYSVFGSGPGIFGLGNYRRLFGFLPIDVWDMENPEDVNGGVNHFGSPFNFPEEFITVYRLHPLVPDVLEFRRWDQDPNAIRESVPVGDTFRKGATDAMRQKGLANWALSMGRQRLGALTLQNHPQFLQNLKMDRLESDTHQIDVAALDLIRDRERGVPRYNEFRRQYGLKQLTTFDDFVNQREPDPNIRAEQERLVQTLREVYGQHPCDASKIITHAQVNDDGSEINDCLGHSNDSLVDNIEDVDTVVGWLAENTRPHGFAISETQFVVFILNASRRLYSDRFLTSSFRPEFYTTFGRDWVMNNGPGPDVLEKGNPNGHEQPVSPMKRVLIRTMPELAGELEHVVNVFDPWARNRGEYYSLQWKPRPGAEADPAFKPER